MWKSGRRVNRNIGDGKKRILRQGREKLYI